MSEILILPDEVVNRIAAGEVVERPCSVIKELVENSLDAGADKIEVEIKDGGKKLIMVKDNGSGMNAVDLRLCVQRHATSKIKNDKDIFSIKTMGFRGEALPSIASVSLMTIISRGKNSRIANEIQLKEGREELIIEKGAPFGTSVEIKDLFLNVPARKKFLKTTRTETSKIINILQKIGLIYPKHRFLLINEGKRVLDLPPANDIIQRVGAVLGHKLAKQLLPLNFKNNSISITGFVSPAQIIRPNAKSIYIFVNNRVVTDRTILGAIKGAYKRLIPQGKYPVAVFMLNIESSMVDVNVHPTKNEVRFNDESELYSLIIYAIRKALDISGINETHLPPYNTSYFIPNQGVRDESTGIAQPTAVFNDNKPYNLSIMEEFDNIQDYPIENNLKFQRLKYIGQWAGLYILLEDALGDLIIIDKHAAHERISYERIIKQLLTKRIDSHYLTIPLQWDCTILEKRQVAEHTEHLDRLGFKIDEFGHQTYVIRAYPVWIKSTELIIDNLRQIIDMLILWGRDFSGKTSQLEELAMKMACHSSVRGNQYLHKEEIEILLSDIDNLNVAGTCPHGRPFWFRYTKNEANRNFLRQ